MLKYLFWRKGWKSQSDPNVIYANLLSVAAFLAYRTWYVDRKTVVVVVLSFLIVDASMR